MEQTAKEKYDRFQIEIEEWQKAIIEVIDEKLNIRVRFRQPKL